MRHFTGNGTNYCQKSSSNLILHIESNLDRLGLLSPTHSQRSQHQSGRIPLQSVLINKPEFFKATRYAAKRKIEIRRSMEVEALGW